MSLLPKVSADFSQCSYWDSFFTNRKREFEWYGDFATLRPWITSYMRPSSSVLVVGAGNSNLSNDLYNLGYQNLLNVDISEVVVRQMSKKFQHLKYVQMDILQPHPELKSNFDVVLDKGTLDALVSDDSQESRERGKQYFTQVDNVLKPLGRYVLVSLLEPYILQILTETFEPM
ncbi:METTL13 [Cordylochernes scorpioides]|uniref:METTL13 n=1 Tax=Cordylochernes scorpioides TaxID=51811 RepID=A0ABY6KCQ5_9ARAC|nr:METTL13 [Cordylochernes scorpioides]